MSLPQCHSQTHLDVVPLQANKGNRIKHCMSFRVVCHDIPGLETSFAWLGRFRTSESKRRGEGFCG